jgi:8-oxo-dGTP pyrophosphatase MutT (NUDIX family)
LSSAGATASHSGQREIYDNGNSAAILPYDPGRKTVLLTRQLRMPIFLQDGIERSVETCAGKLDGETAERRIVKEMEEEPGYRVTEVQRLFELYVSPAAIMERSSSSPVRNPRQSGHRFRRKAATDSDRRRPPDPDEGGHPVDRVRRGKLSAI